MVSFTEQKILILVMSNLPVISPWFMPLVLYLESDQQTQGHLCFSYLSSRSFIKYCEGTKYVSNFFFFFACGCPFDSAPFVEKTM